jgi:23S rRNA (cytosine1962-C5)-methyltransferase
MDQRKGLIAAALLDLFHPASIVERNDSPIRKAETLEDCVGMLAGTEPGPFEVSIHGIRQNVDLVRGQKTGIYLDQIDNYAAVASMAEGKRVLDCFCNQGGFALHCARAGAASVTAIDASESAIAAASENARRNGLKIDFVTGNAFDFLKEQESRCSASGNESGTYDLIVLDPPSFTRNRKSLSGALRGYKEIHLRALKLLGRDGILATFCCSHHVSREEYLQNLCEASVDARRTVRLLASHSQRRDHPIIPTLPETEYLKGFTVQVMAGW